MPGEANKVGVFGQRQSLDPFAFFMDAASWIEGLGGSNPPPFPRYAFHSPYLPANGHALRFSGTVNGLRGSRGTLDLSIYALPPGSAALTRTVARQFLGLPANPTDLNFELEANCFPGFGYALVAMIGEAAEASARNISLHIAFIGESAPASLPVLIPSNDMPPQLFASGPATLVAPVSQMCTAAQFDEPIYQAWMNRMGSPVTHHRKQWEFVYILRCLESFGALERGTLGLGFGVGREPLPSLFATMGVDVVATDLPIEHGDISLWSDTGQHLQSADEMLLPGLCDPETFARHVRFRPVDMTHIPDDLAGFDFTWSSCALEHLGSIEAGLRFIKRSVDCLRPGGFAIHTTEFNLSSDEDTIDHASTVLFRQRDMVSRVDLDETVPTIRMRL